MSFINILAPAGSGGTMMLWSLEYLTQLNLHKSYVDKSFKLHETIVVEDPLIDKCSHRNKKTHPTIYNFEKYYDILMPISKTTLITSYTIDPMTNKSYDYICFLEKKWKNVTHIIFKFNNNDIDTMYGMQFNRIPEWTTILNNILVDKNLIPLNASNNDIIEIHALYYPTMVKEQLYLGKWDQIINYDNIIIIEFSDFLYNLDNIIIELLASVNLQAIPHRFSQWKKIYKRWQKNINVPFYKNISYIVNDIIHNREHDLSKYNMSHINKSIILSNLLYKHNKNLRMNDVSFGALQNSTQWTEILEDNIYHKLEV